MPIENVVIFRDDIFFFLFGEQLNMRSIRFHNEPMSNIKFLLLYICCVWWTIFGVAYSYGHQRNKNIENRLVISFMYSGKKKTNLYIRHIIYFNFAYIYIFLDPKHNKSTTITMNSVIIKENTTKQCLKWMSSIWRVYVYACDAVSLRN